MNNNHNIFFSITKWLQYPSLIQGMVVVTEPPLSLSGTNGAPQVASGPLSSRTPPPPTTPSPGDWCPSNQSPFPHRDQFSGASADPRSAC